MCTYYHIFKLKYTTCRAAQYEAWSNAANRCHAQESAGFLGRWDHSIPFACGLLSGDLTPRMGWWLGLQWAIWASMALTETALPEEKPVTIRNLQPNIWSSLHIFSSFETMPHSWGAAVAFSSGTSNKLLTYVSSSFVADKTAVLSFPSLPRKLEGWEQNQFQGRWVGFEHWKGASQRKAKLNFFESFGGRCTDWFNY